MRFFKIKFASKPKIKTAVELFREMVQVLLGGAFLSLAALQVPWIVELLRPFCTWRDAPRDLQAAQVAAPGAALGGLFVVMILAYIAQEKIMAAVARERTCELSRWQKAGFPIFRHVFINFFYPLRRERGFRAAAGFLSVSALAAWGVAVAFGPMNPGFSLLMAVSVLAGIRAMRLLTGSRFSRAQRIGGFALAGSAAVSLLIGYSFHWNLNRKLEEERRHWRSAGIPLTVSEAEKHYYRGTAPNAEFTRLCNRKQDKEAYSLYSVPGVYYSAPPSERKRLRAYLASEAAEQDFSGIAELITGHPFLKCRVEFVTPLSRTQLPQWNYIREVCRYLGSRIVCAAEDGDREEAMRQFRLLDRFQETALQSSCVIGTLVAAVCERIRCDAIAVLIGSGILTDGDLTEIENRNHGHPEEFREAIRRGERDNAAVDYEDVFFHTHSGLTLKDAFQAESQIHICGHGNNHIFRAFMYWAIVRGSYPPVNPLFLWTNVSDQLNQLHWMRYKRRIIGYYDGSSDYYLREGERTALTEAYQKRPLFCENMLDSAHFFVDRKYSRMFTFFRMTDLGLKIERFRRANGRLPETLAELGIPLPVDAASGELIRYTRGSVRLWDWESGSSEMIPRELPGWQLSAPGGNLDQPKVEPKEHRRDSFTVIAPWPVPAPPEPPPQAEWGPYGPFGGPSK